MSVNQVEEFYLYTTGLNLNLIQKVAIQDLLAEEGYSNYEFQDGGQLVVDDIPSEHEGKTLEDKIYELASK